MRSLKHLSKIGIICVLIAVFLLTASPPISFATPQVEYTQLANKVLQSEPYDDWTFAQWDAQIKYRGIDFKYPEKLVEAAQCYERKIPLVEKQLARVQAIKASRANPALFPEIDINSEQSLVSELARLKDKYACVLKEQEFRKDKKVSRKLHGTTYYIDLDGGSDAADGLGTGTAWLTIEKYTTTTTRSAGDIAKVRANTSEVVGAANIAFDEDGTATSYIEIRGCSIADDPWGDASDVKPIIGFNNGAYDLNINSDDYWRLYRLDVTNSSSTSGLLYIYLSLGVIVDTCDVHLATYTYGSGINISTSRVYSIQGCSLYSNKYYNMQVSNGYAYVSSCIFNGGAAGTSYGMSSSGSVVDIVDSTFGATTTHSTADVMTSYGGAVINLRNCLLSSTIEYSISAAQGKAFIRSEDHDQVKGAQKAWYYAGSIARDATIPLDSLDSAKMSPTSVCSATWSLTLANQLLQGDYQIWCPASATTITIKARETAAWAVNPTNTEFYFEASYLDQAATSAHRAVADSTQTLNGTTEVSFTMTVVPAQAGWVYVTCFCKKYESGKYVNVSVKPTVE